jgi:UDP-glucose 4-epimerase
MVSTTYKQKNTILFIKYMQTILLTGSSGLVGSELLPLFDSKYKVFTVGRKPTDGFEHIPTDFSTHWDTDNFPKNVDVIIHLSQSEHFREFPQKANEVFQVNTYSTLRLLDFARNAGVKNFIYASSGGIYGNGDMHFSEDFPLAPAGDLGFYLSSKLCSEVLLDNYTQFFNVNILRLFFVYGKSQKRTMLIPRLVDSVKEGKTITLQGEQGIKINPIHVSDAATAIIRCINLAGSNKINIAGREILSLKKIINNIEILLQEKAIISNTNQEPKNLIANIEKMKNLLHTPITTLDKGLIEMI